MTTQSNVQALLESGVGLQNGAQSNTPSGINNGNPNTVYNWSSYIPSILRNAQGTPTGANFNLITSQPTASSPPGVNTGYTPPFTADPFAAMLISQLSQYRGPSASQLPRSGPHRSRCTSSLRPCRRRCISASRAFRLSVTPQPGWLGRSPLPCAAGCCPLGLRLRPFGTRCVVLDPCLRQP